MSLPKKIFDTVDPSAFSSESVCHTIARRLVRRVDSLADDQMSMLIAPLKPAARDMVLRGKLQRSALIRAVRSIDQRLGRIETLSHYSAVRIGHKLASDETHGIRLIWADSIDQDSIGFHTADMALERSQFNIILTNLMLEVRYHVIARYMMRERQQPRAFFTSFQHVLRTWPILSAAALRSDNAESCFGGQHLALPMGDGLLLGKVTPEPEHRILDIRMDPVDMQTVQPGWGLHRNLYGFAVPRRTVFRTYVGHNDLTPRRERLRDALLDFEQEHGEGLDHAMARAYYEFGIIKVTDGQKPDVETYINNARDKVQRAEEAAMRLVNGEIWREFCETVQESTRSRDDG